MCYRLKEKTFTDPRVIEGLEEFARLKADMSFLRSPKIADIARRYQINGVPAIIIFNSEGREVLRIPGYIDAGQFLKILRRYDNRLN